VLDSVELTALRRTEWGGGVARRWRLNPPPNWPALPDGWEPDRDWSPDPAWGPAPVGWTLWRRERRSTWLLRHRRSAGVGSAAVLTLLVTLVGPPSAGTFSDAAPDAEAAAVPSRAGALVVPGNPPDRPQAEPAVRLQRRPAPSRERRAAMRSRAAVPAPVETRDGVYRRLPGRGPNAGAPECPPAATPTRDASGEPTPTSSPDTRTEDVLLVAFSRPSSGCDGEDGEGGGSTPGPTGSSSPEPPG
jgi:hypothetical protein